MAEAKAKRASAHYVTIPEMLAINEMLRGALHVFDDKTCEFKDSATTDITIAEDAAAKFATAIKKEHVKRVRKECFGELRRSRRVASNGDIMEMLRDLAKRIEALEEAATNSGTPADLPSGASDA